MMAGVFWKATCTADKTSYDVYWQKSVTLECKTNTGKGSIIWKCGENTCSEINSNYEMRRISDQQRLLMEIKCAGESDGGDYVCEVHTFKGIVKSPAIKLNVWNVIHFPKQEYKATVRRPITLLCEVKNFNSEHPTDIYWTHNSIEIDLTNRKYKETPLPNPSLTICDVSNEDAGHYECRVKDSQSTSSKSICLEINPDVVIIKKKYVAKIHSEVTFVCKLYGAEECTWRHDGKKMFLGENRFRINDDMSLTISEVEQTDAGQYVCEITSRKGEKVTSVEMELRVMPSDFSKSLPEESKTTEEERIELLSEKFSDGKAHIWFIGQCGAGKSSSISSLHSVRGDHVSTVAVPGAGQSSFTPEVSSTRILGNKVWLYDFPGFEKDLSLDNENVRYKPFEDVEKSLEEVDQWKFCIVYVLDCSDEISKEEIKRMNQCNDDFKKKDNFQMVALLTNIDKASQSAATVDEMLESREMCKAAKQINECVGLPMNCIFAIYNYHKQIERNPEMDRLILHTLRCLLERLSDIYDRREREKVVPPEKQKNRPE